MIRAGSLRVLLTALVLVLTVSATVSGCALFETFDTVTVRPRGGDTLPLAVLPSDDPAAASVQASGSVFAASDLAFVAAAEQVEALADDAIDAGAPLLVDGPGVAQELDRLGVTTVVVAAGSATPAISEGRLIIELDAGAEPDASALPRIVIEQPSAAHPLALLGEPGSPGPAQLAAEANVRAVGGEVIPVPGGDPRADSAVIAALRPLAGASFLAIGEAFPEPAMLGARLATATRGLELPGGGQLLFPDRRLVASYGSPLYPELGVLGERELEDSVQHVQELAEQYRPFAQEQVVPAFELIATVASGAPGEDGDYSNETDIELLRPWVERAGAEGIYVVLDLQPGTTHFLEQAKRYEQLLLQPHVGLALDPEWRLAPGQRHLEQIGSVSAQEINAVQDWLADLVRVNALPQKALVVHQFAPFMITDREQLATTHDELAVIMHVDGHGAPGDKLATWRLLQEELPAGVHLAWKNFIDEDTPTFTPEETFAVEPKPWFVSYQ